MRAGKHDGVGALAVIDEGRRDFVPQRGVADRHAGKVVFGIARQFLRAHQRDLAIARVVANERTGIFALHRRLGAKDGDAPCHRAGTGRLDRRHGADERHREFSAQFREHDGGSGVAGDDDQIGPVRRDEFAHQPGDARDQRRLRHGAIWKRCIVGNIEEIGVRPRGRDLAIDGEAAEAGIEYQNGLAFRHRAKQPQ